MGELETLQAVRSRMIKTIDENNEEGGNPWEIILMYCAVTNKIIRLEKQNGSKEENLCKLPRQI
jgi:hypothetical protein